MIWPCFIEVVIGNKMRYAGNRVATPVSSTVSKHYTTQG
jgi:hypothetical protein